MEETHYSNREIDRFMKEIKEQLDRIEEQTTRTNGRVSSLENWRSYQTGAIAIIAAVLLPIVFDLLNHYL